MLLFLVKHTRPDLSNSTRELSKVMDKATEGHMKEFLAENQNSSDRTKHVDIRYHFIRQYIKDGTIMIEFVRSSENDSDIFTKKVTSETFNRHSEKLIWTKEEYKTEAKTRIFATGRVLRGIAYNSSNKGKCTNTNEIMTTGSTEIVSQKR